MGPFCALFAENVSKNEFSWKTELCQFLNIVIIYHRTKNQKKLISHSRESAELMDGRHTDGHTNGQIDRQTDRQTDKSDLIGPLTLHRIGVQLLE